MEAETRFGLQRRVGIVVVAASVLVAIINAAGLVVGFHDAVATVIRSPSVWGLLLIAVLAGPTALIDHTAVRAAQAVIFLATGLAMLLTNPPGSLGGLVFSLYGVLLAIRYGFFAAHRYLKFALVLMAVAVAAGARWLTQPAITAVLGTTVGLVAAAFFYLYWIIFEDEIDRYRLESERLRTEAISNQVFVRFGKNIAGVVHNIKSKLMSIEGFNDLIADEVAEGQDEASDYAALQRRGIQQLRDLIDGLLLTVRSYQRANAETFILSQIIRGAVEMLRANRNVRSGIAIDLDLCKDDDIFASPLAVMQVLDALLQNAWEAMRHSAEREIRITTHLEEGFVVCSIEDYGTGLSFCTPCEYHDCLSCPNFKIGNSSKPDGSGIGVVHARMLVAEMGGRLRFDSVAGRGTTVSVWFPRPQD